MSGLNSLRLFHLLYISKPAADRLVYKQIRGQKACRVVELGIGTGERAVRMIQALSDFHDVKEIHFTGVDLFEARTAAGISLREAHRLLKSTGARIQLAPGTAGEALSRVANGLTQVDALVVSAHIAAEHLAQAWFYIPRMIHAKTQIFQETLSATGATSMRLLESAEIARLSAVGQRKAA